MYMDPVSIHKALLSHLNSALLTRSRCKFVLLPTASKGWGKVMFSVCSHRGGGGTPARSRRGGYLSQGTYPLDRSGWGYPKVPTHPGHGRYPLPQGEDSIWNTWYAPVGMPLAFTQEDFFVTESYANSVKEISLVIYISILIFSNVRNSVSSH